MSWLIIGLGNEGEEYALTRHNAGRLLVDFLEKGEPPAGFKTAILETLMNNSGKALLKLSPKSLNPKRLIIAHDDLDLPLGRFKLSFNRGAGGHRGVESIIKALKTKEFWRLRIGVSPKKKPTGEAAVIKFILGEFKPAELKILKTVFKEGLTSLQQLPS
jgi:PTH1 family peptidyl-tRNA hydrolase